METILLKILEVQNEILAELRQLRQAVCQSAPLGTADQPAQPDASAPASAFAPATGPGPTGAAAAANTPPSALAAPASHPAAAAPASPPASPASESAWSLASTSSAPASSLASASAAQPAAAPSHQPGGRVTANELAALGGQFLDAGTMPRGKVKSVDASDLSLSILDDIKAKNKAKRSAFAEFEKFDKYSRDR